MLKLKSIQNAVKEAYVMSVICILGVFALVSAIIVAWPALAHLASKLFV